MFIAFAILWALAGTYVLFGNWAVYATLVRHEVPVRFLWAATPGYLVRVCINNEQKSGRKLLWFARSTVIVLVVVLITAPMLLSGR